ncbi:MAG: phage minor tail protein L [Amphiplicatus sp.]
MIETEIQKLATSARIELFELDLSALGGPLTRVHAGTNRLLAPIVWQGNTYSPYPFKATGFAITADEKAPRPRLQVADVTGLISALNAQYDDIVGATVTRRRTFAKYLDAVNFPGGVNPTADSDEEAVDIWFIERNSNEVPGEAAEYELASALDLTGVEIPGRVVVQNVCPWDYRGDGCGYAGGPVATIADAPTSDPALDRCGKRTRSCKLRFGEHGELPFGGFEGAGTVRL